MTRLLNVLLLLSLNTPLYSYAVGDEEDVLELKSESHISWDAFNKEQRIEVKPADSRPKRMIKRGNLPLFLVRNQNHQGSGANPSPIQYPALAKMNNSAVEVGDIFECIIEQDLKAYAGSVSPVKATVLNGDMEGLIFVGNATMDPKTKDVVIEFNRMRSAYKGENHTVKATLLSSTGELGLKGTVHSRYWQYFFATVLSRTAEGYAQATVDRDRNIFGQYQEKPNPENAGKVAVAEAASSTADQLANRMQNLPEFVTKKGPIRTKVFITETPQLIK